MNGQIYGVSSIHMENLWVFYGYGFSMGFLWVFLCFPMVFCLDFPFNQSIDAQRPGGERSPRGRPRAAGGLQLRVAAECRLLPAECRRDGTWDLGTLEVIKIPSDK